MIDPAPKVEAAKASAAKPRNAPVVDPVKASSFQKDSNGYATKAPAVEPAVAAPPTERGSIVNDASSGKTDVGKDENCLLEKKTAALTVEALRATNNIIFESPAAVIVGPADKNSFQKLLKPIPIPFFHERSFISYGEVKRYIVLLLTKDQECNAKTLTLFVYAEKTDPSPLYTIPFSSETTTILVPLKEDSKFPDFYSHTVSPEANTGLPFNNKSKGSLETVLLKDASSMKIAYQITFDRLESGEFVSDNFVKAINESIVTGGKGGKKG